MGGRRPRTSPVSTCGAPPAPHPPSRSPPDALPTAPVQHKRKKKKNFFLFSFCFFLFLKASGRLGCPGTYRGLRSQSKDLRAQLRTQPLPSPNWSPGAPTAPLLYRERAAAPLAAIYSPFIPLGEARGGGANGRWPAAAEPAAILRALGAGGARGSVPAWGRPAPHGAAGTEPPPPPGSCGAENVPKTPCLCTARRAARLPVEASCRG